MKIKVPVQLKQLAKKLDKPIYVVGGYVRNYLIDKSLSSDIDVCSATDVDTLSKILTDLGFSIKAVYKRLGTVKFSKDGIDFEYTRFRTDSYKEGGAHKPESTIFTDDICVDALRRDFKCNAIYYDVKNEVLVDPLGGKGDVDKKVISTVTDPEKVFASDGLRLMRLARFSAELGFEIDSETFKGAKKYAKNVLDIKPERIYDELKKILVADAKYPFSPKRAHYNGLKVLETSRVLDYIMPELTLGRGMPQRSDFHDYDVLEHSLRCALYADREVRLDALLHDVAKPYCYNRDGMYYHHATEGIKMSEDILLRLKAPKKDIERVKFTVGSHMIDLKGDASEPSIRKFIVKNQKYLDQLFRVRQADYSACKDDVNENAGVRKWKNILQNMKDEGVAFSVRELKVSAMDLVDCGIEKENLKSTLDYLLEEVAVSPKLNEKNTLIQMAIKRRGA